MKVITKTLNQNPSNSQLRQKFCNFKKDRTNFKKLFISGTWVVRIFHTRASGKFFLTEFRQVHRLTLIVNVYLTLYWFFVHTFCTVSKKATIKRLYQKYSPHPLIRMWLNSNFSNFKQNSKSLELELSKVLYFVPPNSNLDNSNIC